MSSDLRRETAFGLVTVLALAAPALGRAVAAPFAIVALAAFAVTDGPAFELFAGPRDRREGRLVVLGSFALAATGLGLLVPAFGLPPRLFAAAVLLVGAGRVADALVARVRPQPVFTATGFAAGGFVGAVIAQVGVPVLAARSDLITTATAAPALPEVLFLATAGALVAALLREVFPGRQDALLALVVGLELPAFAALVADLPAERVAVAIAVTVLFGYLSWALDTASVAGMLTGVFLGLVTMTLGGYGWFADLFAFFVVGGLATKVGYERKRERGVAEPRGGARGTGNVLGNAATALIAVVGFAAAAAGHLAADPALFLYAFAGSVATALGDTLSSEIGTLFDDPRLITTFERVPPGTDGGVTWQGEVAGIAGASLVAGIGVVAFGLQASGVSAVIAGGVVGMTADSLLGATVEGGRIGNQAVNFIATVTGALATTTLAVVAGLLS